MTRPNDALPIETLKARVSEYRKALVAVEGRLVLAPFQACVGDWFDWVGGNAR